MQTSQMVKKAVCENMKMDMLWRLDFKGFVEWWWWKLFLEMGIFGVSEPWFKDF